MKVACVLLCVSPNNEAGRFFFLKKQLFTSLFSVLLNVSVCASQSVMFVCEWCVCVCQLKQHINIER